AGFVQISYFTYEVVALRIVWALVARERDRPLHFLSRAATALVLPVGLAAVVLVPAREMVRESLRGRPLTPHDIGPGFGWRLLVETAWSQLTIPFDVLVACLAVLAATKLARPHVRSLVLFWGLVVAGS